MSAVKTRRRPQGGAGMLQADDDNQKGSKNMLVAVRIRPLSQREMDAGHSPCCNAINGNIVAIRKEGNASMYLRSQQGR
jgi:hypothetical protein